MLAGDIFSRPPFFPAPSSPASTRRGSGTRRRSRAGGSTGPGAGTRRTGRMEMGPGTEKGKSLSPLTEQARACQKKTK